MIKSVLLHDKQAQGETEV